MGRKKLKRWLDLAIAKLMLARFLLEQRDERDVDYKTVARLISEVRRDDLLRHSRSQ